MNLSRTTLKKAHPYHGICEFCGRVRELGYYDSVLECAVFGVPDEEMGQRVHAVVQPAVTQPVELTLSGVLPEVVLIHIGRFEPSTMDTS